MISALIARCRAKSRSGGSGTWWQVFEILMLFGLKRIGPGYYFLARFWRPGLKLGEKFAHHNESQYRRRINQLNPERYQKISQHKITEKALLTLMGLPTPGFLGFYHPGRGSDPKGAELRCADDMSRFLSGHVGERICFKGVEGSGGSSFTALDVLEVDNGVMLRHPLSGQSIPVEAWVKQLDELRSGWIVEAYLAQHPALAALNPDSVNTLRLIVLHTRAGFVTRGALLRVGRSGSQVDNTSSGGLACPIDLDNGRIVEALDLTPIRNSYATHPDTGVCLVGLTIPHWEACVDVAGRALAAFPNMRFAGVDIAVTESGPSVIELNVYPDRRFAAHLDLPHARLFADAV